MKVCVVIVTYGDRFHLLSQVIEGLRREGVDQLVIIDNGSSSQDQLEAYYRNAAHGMITYRFEKNTGTAKAFKTGIEQAIETGCEFIWLMDDDTLAQPGALAHLKKNWNDLYKKGNEIRLALCSFRNDRPNFVMAAQYNDPSALLPLQNNFAGFHVRSFFSKLSERLLTGRKRTANQANDLVPIDAASYGGLFFHKDLIGKIGLPDESYFLYADDFEFSLRIKKNGGKILLVTKSILHDLENSFYLPSKKKALYHSAFDSPKDSSVYYATRNTIYFSKTNLLTSKSVYLLNKISFLTLITVLGFLRGNFHRLKVIRMAIKDGEKGRLGSNPEFPI